MMNMNFPSFMPGMMMTWFIGIVEETNDPLTLGRVKVRCYGYHPEDRSEVPTKDLPWATVMQPTTSASTSGIGWSPTALENSSMVMGFFADGDEGQYPFVIGTIPHIHRPNAPQNPGGAVGSYTSNTNSTYSTGKGNPPYHGAGQESPEKYPAGPLPNNPGVGASGGDSQAYLTNANENNWPLKNYKASEFKDSISGELRIHHATAMALDSVASSTGKRQIKSGYRSPSTNNKRGGASRSMHMYGRAFDVDKGGGEAFIAACIKAGFTGFGCYNTSYHVDTGSARYWGPDFSARSAPKEFIQMLYRNGWSPSKKPLEGTKVSPGEQATPVNKDDLNPQGGTSSNPQIDPSSKQSIKEGIITSYKAAGYNDVQISGVLSAAQSESTFNPQAMGDNNTSFGLFQWRGDRLDALNKFANAKGTSISDPQTQIDFSLSELNGSHSKSGDALRSAASPRDASLAMSNYERHVGYNNPDSPITSDRIGLANKYAQGYAGPGGINSPAGAYASVPGFNDPTNSLPFGAYQGGPSTHTSARGENASLWNDKDGADATGRLSGFPIGGDGGTFAAEPVSAKSPKYGFNQTYTTKSGHIMSFDDSPGAEVVSIMHKSGSKMEFNPGGSTVDRVKGNKYVGVTGDEYHGIVGDHYLTSQGKQNIRSTDDTILHADGSMMIIVYNDRSDTVSGRYDLVAGDRIEIKSNKSIIVEAPDMSFYASNNMSFQAEKIMNFKAETMTVSTTKDANVHIGQTMRVQADQNLDLQARKAFKVKSEEGINITGEKDITVHSKQNVQVKGDTNVNVEGTTLINLKAPNVRTGDILHVPILRVNTSTNGAQPPSAASTTDPEKLDIQKMPNAASTDLGKAPKRRTVKKQNVPSSNPDVSIADESFKAYSI